jgi:hypothetical protein
MCIGPCQSATVLRVAIYITVGGFALLFREASEAFALAFLIEHAWTLFIMFPTGPMYHIGFNSLVELRLYYWIRELSPDNAINVLSTARFINCIS